MRHVEAAPQQVLAAARDLLRRGLVEGTAGNVSARQADGTVVITPSSLDYATMTPEDMVVMDIDGNTVAGKDGRSPSSESRLHLACYRAFEDVGGVIHSHPVHATMFAVARQPIPACVDEFALYVGGEVRSAAYAPSGSAGVGDRAVEALAGRGAALIANHGLVAVGAHPSEALHITAVVERTAQIIWGARALGTVYPLDGPDDQFARLYAERRRNPPRAG